MLEHLDTVIAFATVMLLLSLLVTTIVQMVIAAAGLRGKCLLDGTEQLLKQLYPGLQDQARTIAEKVLKHPAVAARSAAFGNLFSEREAGGQPANAQGSEPELAVAIRPKELILVLEDLADNDPGLDQATKDTLKELFTKTVGQGSTEMVAKAEELLQKLEAQFPQQVQNLRGAVEGVLGTTQSIVVKVDAWFDTVMDRTSEVFKIHTRKITVAVAVLFSLLLHVDSLALLDQISQDEDVRAQLVQASGAVQDEGEKVLALQEKELATQTLQELAKDQQQPEVAQAVVALCPEGSASPCFAGQRTREDGRSWLTQRLPQDEALRQKVLNAYGTKFNEVSQEHLKDLRLSFDRLQDHLGQTQLEIIPSPIPLFWQYSSFRNFLGVAMTAFFLSLGAPFWYNALRKLSDLRPIVARRVEGEPLKGAPKKEG